MSSWRKVLTVRIRPAAHRYKNSVLVFSFSCNRLTASGLHPFSLITDYHGKGSYPNRRRA